MTEALRYMTPAKFVKQWDEGKIWVDDGYKFLTRYATTLDSITAEVLAGVKTEKHFLFGKVTFIVHLLNGRVRRITRKF